MIATPLHEGSSRSAGLVLTRPFGAGHLIRVRTDQVRLSTTAAERDDRPRPPKLWFGSGGLVPLQAAIETRPCTASFDTSPGVKR